MAAKKKSTPEKSSAGNKKKPDKKQTTAAKKSSQKKKQTAAQKKAPQKTKSLKKTAVTKGKSSSVKKKSDPEKKQGSKSSGINKLIDKFISPELKVKIKRISIGSMIVLFALAVFLFLVRDRFLMRAPLLVMPSPKITFMYGDVNFRDDAYDDWEKARVGLKLSSGYEVKTGVKSHADIVFNDGTAIKLQSNSHFTLDKATIDTLKLRLNKGSIFGTFKKLFNDHKMEVKTNTVVASIRGTELGFVYGEKKPPKKKKKKKGADADSEDKLIPSTTVYALSGITEITNPSRKEDKLLLSYQQKTKLEGDEPPGNPEPMKDGEVKWIRMLLNAIHMEEVIIVSNKLLFEFGSARLKKSSFEELDKIADKLSDSGQKIRIVGHTDNVGTAYANQVLSVQRAKTVRDYLINKGLTPDMLFIAGYGSTKPIEENKTEEGRKHNRRVEFVVVE